MIVTNQPQAKHWVVHLIADGDYSVGQVVQTVSPSMDIQLASNFERYLYYLFNEDPARVREAFIELAKSRRIAFSFCTSGSSSPSSERSFDLGALALGFRTGFPEHFTGRADSELEGDGILHVFANQHRRVDPPKLDLFVAGASHHRAHDSFI